MLFTCHIQLLSKTFDTNSTLHMDLSRKCFIYPLATHGLIYPLDSHGLIYPLTTQASFIHLLHSLICPLAKNASFILLLQNASFIHLLHTAMFIHLLHTAMLSTCHKTPQSISRHIHVLTFYLQKPIVVPNIVIL